MAGLVVKEPHEDTYCQCNQCQIWDDKERTVCNVGVALFITTHWLVVCDNAAQTINDCLHTQGSDEWWNLQESDNTTADCTKNSTDQQYNNQTTDNRDIWKPWKHTSTIVYALQKHCRKTCRQTYHTSSGQVGTFSDQTSGYTAGNDETWGNVYNQVSKVVDTKEVIGADTNNQCQKYDQNNDRVIGQKVFYTF